MTVTTFIALVSFLLFITFFFTLINTNINWYKFKNKNKISGGTLQINYIYYA